MDQNYENLRENFTVYESVDNLLPDYSGAEKRKFLAEFLFMKNEDVEKKVKNLSGGEKARLSLAELAAKRPSLLLLDEVSNNLDIETKNHVIEVLKVYKGALILVSHDIKFVEKLNCDRVYEIKK